MRLIFFISPFCCSVLYSQKSLMIRRPLWMDVVCCHWRLQLKGGSPWELQAIPWASNHHARVTTGIWSIDFSLYVSVRSVEHTALEVCGSKPVMDGCVLSSAPTEHYHCYDAVGYVNSIMSAHMFFFFLFGHLAQLWFKFHKPWLGVLSELLQCLLCMSVELIANLLLICSHHSEMLA